MDNTVSHQELHGERWMIRKANLSDVQKLVELGRVMVSESPRFRQFAFCERQLCESLASFVQDPGYFAAVADVDGEIVGVIIGVARRAWFSSDITATDVVFFVHPDHRGKTHAPRLVKCYMDWADRIGAVCPTLGVSSMVGTQKTVDFLTRMGMSPCGVLLEF